MIRKIISGGQTGVDRAALDVAIHLNVPHSGWCPRGRRAEDGPLAPIYQLQETESFNYAERTEKNVIDSDGTLILHQGPLTGGTLLTVQLAQRWSKPFFTVDLACPWNGHAGPMIDHDNSPNMPSVAGVSSDESPSREPRSLLSWIVAHRIETLNVAGPRESSVPGIGQMAREFLFSFFDGLKELNCEVDLMDE